MKSYHYKGYWIMKRKPFFKYSPLQSEGKEKLCTRVMNETTLRIYSQKMSNTEPFTQDFSTPTVSSTIEEETEEAKDINKKPTYKVNSLSVNLLSPCCSTMNI